MSLGLYISVPFCRSKCSYCNFASGVFSAGQMTRYIDRLMEDMGGSRKLAAQVGAEFPGVVDTVYLGGGTPSLLPPQELRRLFAAVKETFTVSSDAEITVECAPATLSAEMIQTLAAGGVNRVSLGVQSFVDAESASVARLHTREKVLADIANLRAAGIVDINLDLIAGLPHQTLDSWEFSVNEALATAVPHISVYMLEVDEDSRLGRELIAGGTKYHAHSVPDEDVTATFYETACARLEAAGVAQYEISNFARPGHDSRHNLKYWLRRPYLGFGVDAHSMLSAAEPLRARGVDCIRLATTDSYDEFFSGAHTRAAEVTREQAVEESFFLGLRLNRGVELKELETHFPEALAKYAETIEDLVAVGLLARQGENLRLTARGRLLSNEVFEKFVEEPARIGN